MPKTQLCTLLNFDVMFCTALYYIELFSNIMYCTLDITLYTIVTAQWLYNVQYCHFTVYTGESALILATLYSEEIRRPLQLLRISAVLSLADGLYAMVVETPHYTLQQWLGASSMLSTRSSLSRLRLLRHHLYVWPSLPYPTLQPLGFSLCPV